MALQCEPPWVGDIGDGEPADDPDPDWIYESQLEKRLSEEWDEMRRDD